MIATVSPAASNIEETLSTLRYATLLMLIRVYRVSPNVCSVCNVELNDSACLALNS
jgi:hypothetical protein